MREILDINKDLQTVCDKCSESLNIFCDTEVQDNRATVIYGESDFILLKGEDNGRDYPKDIPLAKLSLRTRDMAASWNNVPKGFSDIVGCEGLLSDLKKAAHPSPKRNCMWYVEKELKDAIGDYIQFEDISYDKGAIFNISFKNGKTAKITLSKDKSSFGQYHDLMQVFYLNDNDERCMTADEVITEILNVAVIPDTRANEFIDVVRSVNGKAQIGRGERNEDGGYMDTAKATFDNGYALKFDITENGLILELLGRENMQTYSIAKKIIPDMKSLLDFTRKVATLPLFSVESFQ